MTPESFIQVLLPLRLEWDPFYALPGGVSVHVGDRVRVRFAGREDLGAVSAVNVQPGPEMHRILPVEGVENGLPAILESEFRFWKAIAGYYLCSVGEVFKAAYPALRTESEETGLRRRQALEARIASLEEKLARARKEETRARYRAGIDGARALLEGRSAVSAGPLPILSPAQEKAAESIRKAFSAGKTALLEGVTGSGKTEVYLRLAGEVLQQGRSVLYLVPEIALSRQLEERIATVFPEVLLFHSATSAASRRMVADRIRSGTPYIVLGTRSALFLPHQNLGLIIVDEEHDRSYKQDAPAPRYHGRDAAIFLSLEQGAHVLLGSATPSLESLYNAETGRFVKVYLKERFYPGSPAEIVIIDTVAERRKRGMTGAFSRKLLAEISRTLEEGGQALILRARRSWAPAVQCTECGRILRCPHCNVPLSLHKDPERLVCHYCGHTEPYPPACPHCGGSLQPLGAGTQKVEEELRTLFPSARIDRLDGDTPPTEAAAVIRRFSRKETDILVGTQMITKGFDFEGLQLVAVLQADSLLGQQDFRADEHTVQLLEQFRGRSGRRETPGRFVIQTRSPEHPVFTQLDHPSEESLLAERRLFGFPPYTRIVQIVLHDSILQRLETLSRALRDALPAGLNVTGPYAPPQERVGCETFRHLRVMLPRDKNLSARKRAIQSAVIAFEKERKYAGHITLDVDPL